MLNAFSILLVSELGGEILHHLFSLPLPGSVIGMCFSAVPVTETLRRPELFGRDRGNAPQEHGPAFCSGRGRRDRQSGPH